MIEIFGINKQFNHNFKTIEALKDINFRVEKKSFTSIIGVSGCGKTTLLRIISGITQPTSGHIKIDGKIYRDDKREHRFGMVFQESVLLPWRTVIGNLRLPLEINYEINSLARVSDLLNMVGLESFGDAYPYQLSVGMKARVAIARALILNPSLILMDEAFSNLDEINRNMLNYELLRIWKEINTTILFVTHNISEAVFLSDRIVVLTPRPGQVKRVIDVDLPRPRNQQTRRMPEFTAIVENVREMLMC